MKIAILTLGTRGDVQPYAILGQALQQRGHEVTLSTALNFEALVKSYGIHFLPVKADFQALLDSDEGKKMMKGNPFAVRRNLQTFVYPLITNSLTDFYNLALESDMVLYHVKTLADSFADQFPQKMLRTSLLPIIEPTSAFANPAFSGFPIPSFLNKLSFRLANLSIRMLSNPIKAFREKCGLPTKFSTPLVQNIYGLSTCLLPKPTDYPDSSVFTGFWFDNTNDALSPDLLEFIHAGEPPLLLTFGSMPFTSKFDLQSGILATVQQLQTRMIVVKGWGLAQTEKLENHPHIKVINAAPFEKLFPLTKAIIHHGGIGTTSTCLHAGKPFWICPVMYPIGDQQFWGKHAYEKGVAIAPIPISKMQEKQFISSIKELLHNASLYEKAKQVQICLQKENGLANAIEVIERKYASTL